MSGFYRFFFFFFCRMHVMQHYYSECLSRIIGTLYVWPVLLLLFFSIHKLTWPLPPGLHSEWLYAKIIIKSGVRPLWQLHVLPVVYVCNASSFGHFLTICWNFMMGTCRDEMGIILNWCWLCCQIIKRQFIICHIYRWLWTKFVNVSMA